MDNNLPDIIDTLTDLEQRILNGLLGEGIPIQELAEELRLSEDTISKLADKLWLSLSVESKQQFISFWKST